MIECGSLAQLVEQRLEEPCVPSSSLGGATKFVVRGCSSVVRALPCQGRGRELESLHPHQQGLVKYWSVFFDFKQLVYPC